MRMLLSVPVGCPIPIMYWDYRVIDEIENCPEKPVIPPPSLNHGGGGQFSQRSFASSIKTSISSASQRMRRIYGFVWRL